jgi:hypothetical protein
VSETACSDIGQLLPARVGGWSARNGKKTLFGRLALALTAAAVVIVAVFVIFGGLRPVEMKEPSVGLAVAVLVDAAIIRGVLLPSTMKLLGRWNWYLPRWLEWMPATRFGRHEAPGLRLELVSAAD